MFRKLTPWLAEAFQAEAPVSSAAQVSTKSVPVGREFLAAIRFPEDEIADLLTERSSQTGLVQSPWRTGDFPTESILFPNELLETHRSSEVPERNLDRLTHLWSMSSSHGVSWDELDDAFLSFHREYLKIEAAWAQNYETRFQEEYVKSGTALRSTLQGDEGLVALTMNRRRGKIRRMTYKRLSRERLRDVIRPFQLSAFKDYMRRIVSEKMAKREQSERDL